MFRKCASGLWVAQTPADTEMQGLTYQKQGLDFGIFNKRIGEERVDNGAYHNQAIIDPFSTLDTYVNYTIRNHRLFDQTKIRLTEPTCSTRTTSRAIRWPGRQVWSTSMAAGHAPPYRKQSLRCFRDQWADSNQRS